MKDIVPAPPPPKPVRVRKSEPRESDIERKVCEYAKLQGFYVRKFTSPNHRSVPDRLFISPRGEVFFIEFKAPGKKLTDGQVRESKRLTEYKQQVFVVDGVEKGRKLIDAYGKAG